MDVLGVALLETRCKNHRLQLLLLQKVRVYHPTQIHIRNGIRIQHQKVLIHQIPKLNLTNSITKTLQLPRFHIVQMTFQVDNFLVTGKELLNLLFVIGIQDEYLLDLIIDQPCESVPNSRVLVE